MTTNEELLEAIHAIDKRVAVFAERLEGHVANHPFHELHEQRLNNHEIKIDTMQRKQSWFMGTITTIVAAATIVWGVISKVPSP